MRPTIYTIAKECGVSSATVSRALRRHPSVKTVTADRICSVAEALGYHPSLAARSLVTSGGGGSSRMERPIFIPFNQTSDNRFNDPLFFDYFCGITDRVGAGPYRAELVRFASDMKEFDAVRGLVEQKQIMGLLDFQLNAPTVEYLLEADVPVVTMNSENAKKGIPGVVADYVDGYRQAWRHVLELGHRKVGFFGLRRPHLAHYAECQAGAAMEGALERLSALVEVPMDAAGSSAAMWERLTQALGDWREGGWPTLFFVQNDFIACRMVGLLQRHGIAVPEHVSIIGFDDSASASCTAPSLTTIRLPREQIGHEMTSLLIEIISGRARKRDFVQKLSMKLIPRESSAPMNGGSLQAGLSFFSIDKNTI